MRTQVNKKDRTPGKEISGLFHIFCVSIVEDGGKKINGTEVPGEKY